MSTLKKQTSNPDVLFYSYDKNRSSRYMHRELEFNQTIQPRGYTYLAKIIEIIVPICKDESYTDAWG